MGNKLGRRRQVVDERYTRPHGLYNHKDVDHKKLRKLILESKLAPCYPGDDESTAFDLEECPICFLYYPSLNRSRCCMKSICTECFLQMKVPNSTRPTQCPFCKTENYAVEYRGVKSKEEKGLEQIEEQRVIEAKIRMHQQELKDEEERINKRQEISSSNGNLAPVNVGYCSNAASGSSMSVVEEEEIISSQDASVSPMVGPPPAARTNRDDDFDIDLEDIMVMEAIWLSIQENGRQRNLCPPYAPSRQYINNDCYVTPALGQQCRSSSSASPSGGLACAIAALAERQQVGGESSTMSSIDGNTPSFNMPLYSRLDRDSATYLPADNFHEIPPNETIVMTRDHGEWGMGHGAPFNSAATGYGESVVAEDNGTHRLQPFDCANESIANTADPVVPASFEEQMMLAMAYSLAEARAMSSGQGSSWQ